MLEPTYRSALLQAWKLVWHHKILWILGILSAALSCLRLSNFVGQIIAYDKNSIFSSDFSLYFSFEYWRPMMNTWSLWLMVLVILIGVLVVFLSVAAEGSIIAAAADWYKLNKTPNFRNAWHKGIKHFWRLLTVRLMERIILFSLLLLIGYLISRFVQVDSWFNTIYSAVVFGAGFLIAFVVSAISIYASGYIVHDGNSVGAALQKATFLFRRHVLVSLEMSLIELIISLVTAVLIITAGFWVLIPSVILTSFAVLTGFTSLISFGVVLSLVLYVIMVGIIGAIFHAFLLSSWIYLFMKMHHDGIVSRVMHFFRFKNV